MADSLSISLGVLQIVLQLVAAWYAYKVLRFMGAARFWLLIILALVLMSLRRLTVLVTELGLAPALTGELAFIDRFVLPFLISIFLVLGLYELHQRLSKKL